MQNLWREFCFDFPFEILLLLHCINPIIELSVGVTLVEKLKLHREINYSKRNKRYFAL